MYCLETTSLVHRYPGDETVLNGINLQVVEGSIYGFLGPNGAGKTTTLRLILGLLKRQQGSISVFGKPFETHRIEILRNVGSLIESPSLYDHLTATENLALLQTIYRCPKRRIQEVLNLVGLPQTGGKKTGRFSLGMKQRLSIAVALLHNPALLILDEPTNGLDPNGIIEIREVLQTLNRQRGTTIIISSHLLAEIDKLVTHLGIISRGRLVFQGELEELKHKQQQISSVALSVSDIAKAWKMVEAIHPLASIRNGKIVLPATSSEAIASLNRQLVLDGVDVCEIDVVRNDLEAIFMNLVR
jgi:ABC-type multidrug transport system ATPase subunit